MDNDEVRSLTTHLPTYPEARYFLRVLDTVSYTLYRNTYNHIMEQQGNPQAQVDWTNPNEWIAKRLTGEEQALAWRIWHESQHQLNPRHLRGSWYLVTKHNLLAKDNSTLRVTGRGRQFLTEAEGPIVAEIDSYEGLLTVLKVVAERGPGKRSDFLSDYADYCRTYTTYQSETAIKSALYSRLVNLIERGYILRSGQVYEITNKGLAYLDTYAIFVPGGTTATKEAQSEIRKLAREISQKARDQLSERLSSIDPYKFEALIKFLLEEMGYTEVKVTSATNDKGVDVVANIELGISSVREVVQVKRYKGNINRQVLDQLRGSLHRFSAVRGTIITTGGFSKGTSEAAFERGAAPITLIDGEKLLDLLIQYEIGITKRTVEYLEFDDSNLAQFESEGASDVDELNVDTR